VFQLPFWSCTSPQRWLITMSATQRTPAALYAATQARSSASEPYLLLKLYSCDGK